MHLCQVDSGVWTPSLYPCLPRFMRVMNGQNMAYKYYVVKLELDAKDWLKLSRPRSGRVWEEVLVRNGCSVSISKHSK